MKTPTEFHTYFRHRFGDDYVSKLAKQIGRPYHAVSKTLNGKEWNFAIRKEIAEESNLPVEKMWEPAFDIVTGLKKADAA